MGCCRVFRVLRRNALSTPPVPRSNARRSRVRDRCSPLAAAWPRRDHPRSVQRDHVHDTRPQLLARSEAHTSELQSLMRISYAVFCLKENIKAQIKSTQLKLNILVDL